MRAMTPVRIVCVLLLTLPTVGLVGGQNQGRSGASHTAPRADHHQHLFSPELAALMSTTPPVAAVKPRTATDLVAQLDAAGIRRAVVLSTAYISNSRHARLTQRPKSSSARTTGPATRSRNTRTVWSDSAVSTR